MKITGNQNIVKAIEAQNGLLDRNLPIYITNYTVEVAPQYESKASVLWSTVSFLPSLEATQRVFRVQLAASILVPFGNVSNDLSDLTFMFDFSAVGRQFEDEYLILLEGPLEGYITVGDTTQALNAFTFVNYTYRRSEFQFLLDLVNLPESSPTFPMTVYIDISIKDDTTDPYPSLLPSVVATNIFRIPTNTGHRGEGIRVVLPLMVCCPEDLKTLQISETNITLPGAFDCRDEINWLLQTQNIPEPYNYIIRFQAAQPYPQETVLPVDWKTVFAFRHTCFELENLLTTIPDCTVIVLYTYLPLTYIDTPMYMTWLKDNTESYDIVATSQFLNLKNDWPATSFNVTYDFYNNAHAVINANKRTFLCAQSNQGNNETVTRPDGNYNFSVTNINVIGMGGIILNAQYNYPVGGPYQASYYSNGGYCNAVLRPPNQYGINYSPQNGSPDLAGYFGGYNFCLDYGQFKRDYGCSWTVQPLAGLMAMIMNNTSKKDWDFKFILYRKASSIIMQIRDGVNNGNPPDRYFCPAFVFWNPVCGLGNLNGQYLYNMCNRIRNNTVVQLSSASLNHNVSFLNFMPRNTFADFIERQPVFGFSSIFTLFRIFKAAGPGRPPLDNSEIVTNQEVYFIDITGKYALSYGYDPTNKLYVFIQNVNYGSIAQKWVLRSYLEPNSILYVNAFDKVTLSPAMEPNSFLSNFFNANLSQRPNSPSIATTFSGVEAEAFMFNTDPASDNQVQTITNRLSDDTFIYSYYTNITYVLPTYDQTFLNNPQYLSMNSNPQTIYEARDNANSGIVAPRWGPFDDYPQWVLVPVMDSSIEPPPYLSELLVNATYMIYNTVMQSYLCVDNIQGRVTFRHISYTTTNTVAFTQFLFELDKSNVGGALFAPKTPTRPNVLPSNVEFELFREVISIYNRQMVEPPYNGTFKYFVFAEPTAFDSALSLTELDTPPSLRDQYILIYWVFKKYMLNMKRPSRLMAYNNDFTPQDNNGKDISVLNSAGNYNNNAPSMQDDIFMSNRVWNVYANTYVRDTYQPDLPFSRYLTLDENLKEVSVTELSIVSAVQTQTDPPLEMLMAVYGPEPQPIIVTLEYDSKWSGSTINRFVKDPAMFTRRNYMYIYTLYSFFSNTNGSVTGFLSSERKGVLTTSPGWAPSLYYPPEATSILIGTEQTQWTLI